MLVMLLIMGMVAWIVARAERSSDVNLPPTYMEVLQARPFPSGKSPFSLGSVHQNILVGGRVVVGVLHF